MVIDNTEILLLRAISKDTVIVDHVKIFVWYVLNKASNKVDDSTGNTFLLLITLISKRVSDMSVRKRDNTRLSNNRSFDITTYVRDNLFEGGGFSKMNVPRSLISRGFTFVVIESIEELNFLL